jgi:hypothetical protein
MTYEEFKSLKTGSGDPITPEKLMSRILWRLDDLQKMKKSRNLAGDLDVRIDELNFLLSVDMDEDGNIEPTHYYD